MALSPFLVNSIFSFFFFLIRTKQAFQYGILFCITDSCSTFDPGIIFSPAYRGAFCAAVYFPLQLPSLLGFVLLPCLTAFSKVLHQDLNCKVFILKTFETVLCSQAHAANQAPGFSNTTFGCFLRKHQSRLDGKVRPLP